MTIQQAEDILPSARSLSIVVSDLLISIHCKIKEQTSAEIDKGVVNDDNYAVDMADRTMRTPKNSKFNHLLQISLVSLWAPKSLLGLRDILDEYIHLKEQKVLLDQEKWCLEKEKFQIQMMLQGLQDVMNNHNASGNSTPPLHPRP